MNKNCLIYRGLKAFSLVFCFLTAGLTYAQTADEIKRITSSYDQNFLTRLAEEYKSIQQAEKEEAIRLATIMNRPVRIEEDGRLKELQKVTPEGTFIYYTTFNADAAKSTRTNHLNNGGSLGLNLMGLNMTAHIWDGGLARITHREYDGAGGNNRYSIGDGTTATHPHSAHVAGTIMASGVTSTAKGMAPYAKAVGYDWNNDLSEATNAANNKGMLISNHSYGYDASQSGFPNQYFGAYISESRSWDQLQFNAPYYLMVVAAGNDGLANYNTQPLNGVAGYDKLTGHSTSKNTLVVANARDANVDSNGNLISVVIEPTSSQGPTDDYRIKPDIAGNGYSVYSTLANADNSYGTMTGTSMASPNVAGSLLLLQEYYNQLNSNYMLAATLKGLVLHTADDAGPTGPDAVWGWGLLNSKRAAETITANGSSSIIQELTLNSGSSYVFTANSDGINPLIASISWTDRPGAVNNNLNSSTPALVNDLDIRITQGSTTYYPWRLSGVTTNTQGDNKVDPFERIDIPNASGTYTVTISHKGSLVGGSQKYSLILTGLAIGACSGTPDAGTAAASDNPVCPNRPFTLISTGASTGVGTTYQWQSSPAGANTWTDIPGANNINYILNSGINQATDFRMVAHCSNSGQSHTSNEFTVSIKAALDCYCELSGIGEVEPITRVTFADIDHSSSVNSTLAYENFTSVLGHVEAGNSYTFSAEGYTGGSYVNTVSVFIDWNQDGHFDDVTERYDIGTIINSTGLDGKQATNTLTVPADALVGTTRMRVIKQYSDPQTPYQYAIDGCEAGSMWGQAEDYSIGVVQSCGSSLISVNSNEACSSEEAEIVVSANAASNLIKLFESPTDTIPIQTLSGNSGSFFVNIDSDTTFYVAASDGNCDSPKSSVLVELKEEPEEFEIYKTVFQNETEECELLYAELSTGEAGIELLFDEDSSPNYGVGVGGTNLNKVDFFQSNTNHAGGQAPEFMFASIFHINNTNGNWIYAPWDGDIDGRMYIDLSEHSNAQLEFKHNFRMQSGFGLSRNISIDVSTDGTNFVSIWNRTNITQDINAETITIDLSDYDGEPKFYFQFRYNGSSRGINQWYFDDIKLSGENQPAKVIWSPTDGLYTDATLSTPYTGELSSVVYASPDFTTQYTATLSNGICDRIETEEVNAAASQFIANTGNWNEASNWTPAKIPDLQRCVRVPNGKILTVNTADAEARKVQIDAGGSLVLASGQALTLAENMVNLASADQVIVQNDASLIQLDDYAVNVGAIQLEKEFLFSAARKEYNFVGSPLVGFNIKTLYPNTSFSLVYNETTNYFVNHSGAYSAALGFALKEASGSGELTTMGVFEGVAFNGNTNYPLQKNDQGFNLLANPYPSSLDLKELYQDHSTEIESDFYFWDNRGNAWWQQEGSNYGNQTYHGNQYAKYNAVSDTGNPAPTAIDPNDPDVKKIPNRYVKPGTGFLVQATQTTSNIEFKNDYRAHQTTGPAFTGRTESEGDYDRYWLEIKTANGFSATTAVVYFEGGSHAVGAEDSEADGSSDEIYSLANDQQLSIQGKPTFVDTDVIPIGFRTYRAGNHQIGIYKMEGAFAAGQKIYLKDKDLAIIHDLSQGEYHFKSRAGEFNNRFEIVYKKGNKASGDVLQRNEIAVQKINHEIEVTSTLDKIVEVEFYNLTGRSVMKAKRINNHTWSIPASRYDKQILVVVVKTETGEVVTKKLVNQ